MIVVLVGQSALASFFKLCMLLIAFILILVASYYVTRWYAQSGLSADRTTIWRLSIHCRWDRTARYALYGLVRNISQCPSVRIISVF